MFTKISDNPADATAITGFIATVLTLLVAFGIHVTPEQTQAILAFIAALWLVLGVITRYTTVPKTPSAASPALLQVPPPGTVLVTKDAAASPGPVTASGTVATSPEPAPPAVP
jgi:uncharacterized membrane protein